MRSPQSKPFIIPVFLPHAACPHQCAFCNQALITNQKPVPLSLETIEINIRKFLQFKHERRGKVQIAFFGGNFLGIEYDEMVALLKMATRFVQRGDAHSLRFSTRPETIHPDSLEWIDPFPVETIEVGVQSMDDAVLTASRRGHTSAETEAAVGLLNKTDYEIGLQMMVGLPGDSQEKAMASARRMIRLSPDFVRVYPTVVLKGSSLARWYQEGRYTPLPLGRCVTLVKKLYLFFNEHHIRVIRMGLPASESFQDESVILAGPYHPAFGHLVLSEIFRDRAMAEIASFSKHEKAFRIRIHPKHISRMKGLKNNNIQFLLRRFRLKALYIEPDPSIRPDKLTVESIS